MLRRSSGWLEKGYSTSLLIPYPHRRLARTHMILLFPAFTHLRDFLDKSISTVIPTVLRSASRGKTCTKSTHAIRNDHTHCMGAASHAAEMRSIATDVAIVPSGCAVQKRMKHNCFCLGRAESCGPKGTMRSRSPREGAL